jgi:hypothetical protein
VRTFSRESLEATAHGNVITLKPKAVIDRHPDIDARLREALEDVKAGRVLKPFHSVKELMADLNRTSKEKKRKAGKVQEDWSPEKHSLTAFFAAHPAFAEKVSVVKTGTPHVIDLLDKLEF